MDKSRPQTAFKIPQREYLGGTSPAARKTATDIERTKLESIYAAAEHNAFAQFHTEERPAPQKDTVRTREKIVQTIDQTPANQVPDLSDSQTLTIHKSHLDKYHKAWQEYYQRYYNDYYTKNLKNEVRSVKKQKIRHGLATTATKDDTPENEKIAARKLHHEIIYKAKKTVRKVKGSKHFRPVLAGILTAAVVAFIQFNQLLTGTVAAFVAPSDNINQPLLIASIEDMPVGPDNLLVIPKLGLESPLVFDAASNSEADMQTALERGVVHYNLPDANSLPGQKGNTVFLGHSAGDVFYGGHFKYIFSRLNRLASGDTFYINFNGVRYIYSIQSTEIIYPDQLERLVINDGNAWVTLVTCDPPGSSLRRLIIYAKQISPDLNADSAAKPDTNPSDTTPRQITGKTPTLFERIFGY